MNISLIQACELALSFSGWSYIENITKIETGYVFGFLDENGDTPIESPILVKDDGEIEIFFPPDHIEELSNPDNYKIIVPDKYSL